MASSSELGQVGDDDGAASLFDGMVLFPSSIDPSLPQVDRWQQPASDATTTIQPSLQPQPLDEDLFSDLTLQAPPSPPPILPDPPTPSPSPALPSSASPQPALLTVRHPSRKKKRAVRIGYAREPAGGAAVPSEDLHSPPPSMASTIGAATASKMAMVDEPSTSSRDIDVGSDQHPDTAQPVEEDDLPPAPRTKSLERNEGRSYEVVLKEDEDQRPPVEDQDDEEALSPGKSAAKGDLFVSAEERLQRVRAQISEKLESIRQRSASAYAERKGLERRRRKAVDSVNSASARHKDLERELELACEAEDFERAERLSEDLATLEEEKSKLQVSLRDAEADCESAESKMQEVLELQIVAEEEGTDLLEQFAKV